MKGKNNPAPQQPPPPPESTWSSRLFILIICILFRWWNAHLTRTYDNPDEYWQAPEVAHRLVFGYGYMTWEWTQRIRSYFHPLVFACLYKCLAWCHLDSPSLLQSAPKYLQATLSAFGDMATYSLAKKVYGNQMAPFILFVTLISWFNFLMAARTLSNTMETVFTVIAMKDWPFPGIPTTRNWLWDYRKSLFWASLACITRPTNALVWGFLGLQLLYHASSYQRWTILINAGMIVSIVFLLNIFIDTYFYTGHLLLPWQDWVFVPWTFIKTNILQSIAVFYGVHPIHWYISQGLPLMLLTFLPLTILGFWKNNNTNMTTTTTSLKQVVIWVICIYSLLSHKEFRFIYPIFPLLMIFTANGLWISWHSSSSFSRLRWLMVFGIGLTQMVFGLYISLWHQRGVMDVMTWLRSTTNESVDVGFLMPCHSTPWHSVMHQQDRPMWFLTCDPPLLPGADTQDEAAVFYHDPVAFLQQQQPGWWPDVLVMFEHLLTRPGVVDILENQGYVECQRFFNSHAHWDGRRKGDVVVFSLQCTTGSSSR